ncbi:MAG TPA: TRAP transporter substrate-binding protein [Usitatibacter sp.]|nr:TRAP transporter substrate-binding protein [Usitatibacter sp.]
MNTDERRWSGLAWAAVVALGIALPSQAHEHGETWALANEYPATSLPGEGDEELARLVADETHGRVSIVTLPDARMGYKSREQLKAVADGKVAMADTFGGAISEAEPVFALASLPFIAPTIADARALYDAARPSYEAAFERHNQKLLYATPWPPSGLWTKAPADTLEAVAKLKIRTYDKTGTDIFTRLGAKASVVSFADLGPKLASGEIDAVLSSGDGGAGRKLWEHLPRFTEIDYAIPLSFTTVNLDRWKALDDAARAGVLRAAKEVEARQWKALESRLAKNYERMKAQGMTIVTGISPQLRQRLREEGRDAARDWAERTGPEAREILERR